MRSQLLDPQRHVGRIATPAKRSRTTPALGSLQRAASGSMGTSRTQKRPSVLTWVVLTRPVLTRMLPQTTGSVSRGRIVVKGSP